MKNNNTPTQCPPQRQRGAGLVEYVAVTGILLGALLTPFGDGQNAVQRVTNAVKDEHAGYLYLASFPSLPRSDAALSALGDQVASNGGGGHRRHCGLSRLSRTDKLSDSPKGLIYLGGDSVVERLV